MSIFSSISLHDFSAPLSRRVIRRKTTGPYQFFPTNAGRTQFRGFYSSLRSPLVMDRAGSPIRLRLEFANDWLPRHPRFPVGYRASSDEFSDLYQPIIARLPHGRGYLAGWTLGAGMLGTLESRIYSSLEEAAWSAHELAGDQADEDRESAREIEDLAAAE